MTTFTTMLAFTIIETIVRSWLTITARPPSSCVAPRASRPA
jgi:hypothetical protein